MISVLFKNIDQGKNKFGLHSRASTRYYHERGTLKICVFGCPDRWIFDYPKAKAELLYKFTGYVAGGHGMRLRIKQNQPVERGLASLDQVKATPDHKKTDAQSIA